jgi:ABC-type iron transport system FetAB ATPase subunit
MRPEPDKVSLFMSAKDKSEPLLRVSDMAVAADGAYLLRGVDLTVRPAEIVGMTGPSGCGKTTLLRAIACLNDAVGGALLLQGCRPEDVGWPAYRRQVMLVPQRPVMFEGTVQRNLERAFLYRTAEGPCPLDRAEGLLDRLGIGRDRLSQEARSLSEGQQQRVAVIRALLGKPKVLLMDEPTSALDASARDALEAVIREEVTSRGLAVVVVTHDAEQATRWCDRRYALDAHVVARQQPGENG